MLIHVRILVSFNRMSRSRKALWSTAIMRILLPLNCNQCVLYSSSIIDLFQNQSEQMENTEKFRMRMYSKQTGINIYAARGVDESLFYSQCSVNLEKLFPERATESNLCAQFLFQTKLFFNV